MTNEPNKITVGETIVPSYLAETNQDLRKLINFLISRKRQITVRIETNKTLYTSRIIKADYGDLLSKIGKGHALVIEKLTPDTGNALLKLSRRIVIQFLLRDKSCQFDSRYLGESTKYPHIGLIVSFPESVVMKERRNYDRNTKRIPNFLHAILTLRKGAKRAVTYKLKIINRSANGVGMLVTKKDFDLLETVNEGEELQDVELYAPTAMVKVTGIVIHKTKLDGPKYKGSYVLGIELDETLVEIDLS